MEWFITLVKLRRRQNFLSNSGTTMRAELLRISVSLFALGVFHSLLPVGTSDECRNQGLVTCPDSTWFSHKCIYEEQICDGNNDCHDNSDEAYCDQIQPISCPSNEFQCSSGHCKPRNSFCNRQNDCGDNSDEFYCDFGPADVKRPTNWIRCNAFPRFIQSNWWCDGTADCPNQFDELYCSSTTTPQLHTTKKISILNRSQGGKGGVNIPDVTLTSRKGIRWLLNQRKSDSSTDRWGPELHRIATGLYLSDKRFFAPGNKTGEEIGYELTIQLLHKLSGNNTIRSQELALYIQALTVTCNDPRDFFGHNLVSELRRRVEASNYTNPFEILALCNAKDNMTNDDIGRVSTAFDSPLRPFWTDTQAIAAMAMQCLSSSPNVRVDERMVKDMQDELKKRQFRNGSVENPITTALVVQALQSRHGYKEYFDLSGAISVLKDSQKSNGSWGSIRNSYYVLPAIHMKNYLNISSNHCVKRQETEEEALRKLQDARGDKFIVMYSIWIGNHVDLGRTWKVRVKTSSDTSFYDVIEMVQKLDPTHNVTYNVIDNKPYVSALFGKADDPELGLYWFTYVRSLQPQEAPKLIEASPVDVRVATSQELILWYKPGKWSAQRE